MSLLAEEGQDLIFPAVTTVNWLYTFPAAIYTGLFCTIQRTVYFHYAQPIMLISESFHSLGYSDINCVQGPCLILSYPAHMKGVLLWGWVHRSTAYHQYLGSLQ